MSEEQTFTLSIEELDDTFDCGFKSVTSSLSSCWDWCFSKLDRCFQSGCFPYLKMIWKNYKALIKLTMKISMHIVFNLILSAIDVGTDIVAAMNHFR